MPTTWTLSDEDADDLLHIVRIEAFRKSLSVAEKARADRVYQALTGNRSVTLPNQGEMFDPCRLPEGHRYNDAGRCAWCDAEGLPNQGEMFDPYVSADDVDLDHATAEMYRQDRRDSDRPA